MSWTAVAHAASYTVWQATSANGTYTFTKNAATSPTTTPALLVGTFFFKVTVTIGDNWLSAMSVASDSRTIAAVACL